MIPYDFLGHPAKGRVSSVPPLIWNQLWEIMRRLINAKGLRPSVSVSMALARCCDVTVYLIPQVTRPPDMARPFDSIHSCPPTRSIYVPSTIIFYEGNRNARRDPKRPFKRNRFVIQSLKAARILLRRITCLLWPNCDGLHYALTHLKFDN